MPQLIDLAAVSGETLFHVARLTMDAEFAYVHLLNDAQRVLFTDKEDFVERYLSRFFAIKPLEQNQREEIKGASLRIQAICTHANIREKHTPGCQCVKCAVIDDQRENGCTCAYCKGLR